MNTFYQYLNTFPMPLWLAMMFFPHHPWTQRMSRSSTIFGIAGLHYTTTLLLAIRHSQQSGQAADMRHLAGVQAMLGTPAGTLAAWSHMLALDLFAGAWIYRECLRLRAPAWVRIVALFGTLMAGPLGLSFFLAWRGTLGNQGEALTATS